MKSRRKKRVAMDGLRRTKKRERMGRKLKSRRRR